MYRFAIVLALSAGLGACVSSGPEPVVSSSLDQLVEPAARGAVRHQATLAVQNSFAALPPDAGRIEKVASQQYADGVHQTIGYDKAVPGLKANEIDLRLRTTMTVALIEPLSIEKPSEAAIRAELASQFPRMEMRIVDRPRSNAYGIYGFAVGKWANGTRCIYAWQWIDSLKTPDSATAANSASLRVRFCRVGVTLDYLANLIDGLQLEPSRLQETSRVASSAKIETIRDAPRRTAESRSRKSGQEPAKLRQAKREAEKPNLSPRAIPRADPILADLPEPPLDPSLPAAAYRGPTMATVGRQPNH